MFMAAHRNTDVRGEPNLTVQIAMFRVSSDDICQSAGVGQELRFAFANHLAGSEILGWRELLDHVLEDLLS
jgi:hypothetical protein